jgi:hypothetical protein
MIENPVFIVGTERSGSNLLRLLLNESPEIAIPHPPHLMRDLAPVVGRYGDLTDDRCFRRLIASAVRLVDLHFAPWPFRLDEQKIFTQAAARDLYSIYAAIYEQYRIHLGKARWGCKSTFMVHHVREILRHHESPQFIHLVRDPRDVAVSARRSVFCHYHPYYVANLWRAEQMQALLWSRCLPASAWLTLRYEDLIRTPEDSLREVCAFLKIDYSPELLRYFEKPAARELAGLSRSWSNVGQPVLKDNSEKFRAQLSPSALRVIESVAGREMEQFGYTPVTAPELLHMEPGFLRRMRFLIAEEALMLREESRALFKDGNAGFRFRKKAYLLALNWL